MKRIGIAANTSKAGVLEVVEDICAYLEKYAAKIFLEPALVELTGRNSAPLEEAEALLVIGGDGTILAHAPWAMKTGIPIVGINLGHVGFLNNIELNDLHHSLDKLVADDYTLISRAMLEGSLFGNQYYALNDFTLFKKHFSHTIDVRVSINEVAMAKFACDGLLVSTPVGSTAYSLSAGGPIVSPNVSAMLVTPICAHTLSARPMVVGDRDKISLEINEGHCTEGIVIVDGIVQEQSFSESDLLEIRISEQTVPFILVNDYNFFELVRKKLY